MNKHIHTPTQLDTVKFIFQGTFFQVFTWPANLFTNNKAKVLLSRYHPIFCLLSHFLIATEGCPLL